MAAPRTAVRRTIRSPARATAALRTSWPVLAVCTLLVGLVLAAFAPVAGAGLVMFDDDFLGPGNPGVRAGLSAAGLRYAWTNLIGFWHPLTWMSLQLDAELYGPSPAGFHITNLLVHGASTLVLFSALRAMTRAAWPSALAAALFAVHPLNVEPVAWVAERRGLLATFFWVLAMSAYARYALRPTGAHYALVALALTLGLIAKATAVTLPFALLLLDFWPLGRLGAESTGRLLWEKLPLLGLAAAFAGLTVVAERTSGALEWLEVPLSMRLSNAVASYVRYLGMAAWPLALSPFYRHAGADLSAYTGAASAALLVAVTAGAFALRRRCPYATTGWLWYLGTLLPVIGLVQVGRHGMADRYTYVPLIGIWVAAAWSLAEVARRWHAAALAMGVAGVVLAACVGVSRAQVSYWHDNCALWGHALDVDPDNALAHNSFGVALSGRGDADGAMAHFRTAVRLDRGYAMAHYNLGMALGRRGELEAAVAAFRESIRLDPRYAESHYNLGVALGRLGRSEEAARAFSEAVRLNPLDAKSHHNLAVALRRLGRAEAARRHEAEARRLEAAAARPGG